MAKIEVHEKFPCGYEINVVLESLFGNPFYEESGICPLHGKKCTKGRLDDGK